MIVVTYVQEEIYQVRKKWSEYMGWKIEYVPYNSGDQNKDIQDAMDDLEAGKVDLLGPLLKNSIISWVIEKFSPREYYFAAAPGNTALVNELEQAIEILDKV